MNHTISQSPRPLAAAQPASWLLAVLLLAAAALAKDIQFEQAESLKSKKKYDEAIPLYQAVIARAESDPDHKVRSQWSIIECLRQLKKHEEALAASTTLYQSLPADHWMKRQAAATSCDILQQLNRHDQAADLAAKVAQDATDEREIAADWHMRAAYILMRVKKYPEAYQQGGKAVEAAKEAEEHRRVLDALWVQADAMYLLQDHEKCLVPLKAALELHFQDQPPNQWTRFKQRMAECYIKLNQLAEVREAYKRFLSDETDAPQRQRWWIGVARTWETEKNLAQAIAAYNQVIADHPEQACRDHWPEAQSAIMRMVVQDTDNTQSLKMLHLALDLADSRDRIQSAASQIVNLLKKIDGNSTRAKAFAAYQQLGRAGPDANLGTPDDLTDPLESIGYPDHTARIAAFHAASAKLGNDAQASLHRGWMCMYIGRPKEAVAWFIDAARRGAGDEFQSAVNALVFCAARSATGSASDVEKFADYILHGPAGADAKSKLADPISPLAAPTALPATPLTPADRATLQEVARRLSLGLEQEIWQTEMKPDVIATLERVHGGLADWNAPALADWYFARIKAEPVTKTQESMLASALAAARAGQFHLAGLRRFLTRLEGEAGGKPIVRETARKAWNNWISKLELTSRTKSIVPKLVVK